MPTEETSRVEAFSDGVFAIAITLLVLDLKVPRGLDAAHLRQALLEQWAAYLSFAASFAVIGIMWVNHHRMFQLIRRATHGILLFNGLLLFMISATPFTTALASEYLGKDGQRLASVVYCGWFVLTAMVWNVMWRYVASPARGPGILTDSPQSDVIRGVTRSYLIGPVSYGAATLVAIWAPVGGVVLAGAVGVIFALSVVVDPTKRYR